MTQTQEDLPSSTRSYDWTEPAGVLPLLATLPGADYVAGVGDGTVPPPPIASTLGFGRISLVDGAVLLEMEPQSFHDNPIGSMHGGVIATMLDTVTGCAVHATLPVGVTYTSLDLSVRFIRAVRPARGPSPRPDAWSTAGRGPRSPRRAWWTGRVGCSPRRRPPASSSNRHERAVMSGPS